MDVHSSISDDGNLTLSCTAIGVPVPNITWTYNNRTLPMDDIDNTVISYGVIRSVLSIEDVSIDESGLYQCHAMANGYGSVVSNNGNISVFGKHSNYNIIKFILFSIL